MRHKTTARRCFSILLNSRLAIFAFGILVLGLPHGLLPAPIALADEATKQDPSAAVPKQAADLTEAIRLNPNDAAAYLARGRYRAEKRQFDRALADFNEAIRLNPTDASAFAWRGWVWLVQEQFDKAIEDYTEAIRLDPENQEHLEHLDDARKKKEVLRWGFRVMFVLICFIGCLSVGTAIPLILRKVPPNPWYGFRVQATLENPAIWYPANAFVGKCMVVFGLIVTATSIVLFLIPGIPFLVYTMSCVGILIIGSLVLLILSVQYLQTLSRLL